MTILNQSSAPSGNTQGNALDNIPGTLKREGRFCFWKYQPRPGSDKPAKAPYTPKTGTSASCSDPSTFGAFPDVQDYAVKGYNGVGVLMAGLRDGSRIVAVDIDHCIDDQGQFSPMAAKIIQVMKSYTEVSPSGRGIRILSKVSASFKFDKSRYYINNQGSHLEVYDGDVTAKYVTVTGRTLTPGVDLELRDQELLAVLEEHMVRKDPVTPQSLPASPRITGNQSCQLTQGDMALIESLKNGQNGEKFAALMDGDTSQYDNDASRGDMALCNFLAAKTQDANQIDRIVRNSKLMRDKWERQDGTYGTYGMRTISKALNSARAYHQNLEQQRNPCQTVPQAPVVPQQAVPQQAAPQQVAPQQVVPQQVAPQAPVAPQQVVPQQVAPQQVVPAAPPTAMSVQQAFPQAQLTAPAAPPKAMVVQQTASQVKIPPLVSATQLACMTLRSLLYLVEGMLPEGLTFLVSSPKIGKSFMCLQLALALTSGTPFLGRQTIQVGVLYMALEDGYRRLQTRMSALLNGQTIPQNLYFVTETFQTDTYLYEALDLYLSQDPAIKLVIIDTFQCVRGRAAMQKSSYLNDSREVSTLKKYADSKGISILLVHHVRKMDDENDVYNKISGSTGLMGSADTSIVIDKKKRSDKSAEMHITGRDVVMQDLVISFDESSKQWVCLGTAPDAARQAYEDNQTVITIRELLKASTNGQWEGRATDLLDAGKAKGRILSNSPQGMGKELTRLENDLLTYDGIQHTTTKSNGNGNVIHHFFAPIVAQTTEPNGSEASTPNESVYATEPNEFMSIEAPESNGLASVNDTANTDDYPDDPESGWDGTDDIKED